LDHPVDDRFVIQNGIEAWQHSQNGENPIVPRHPIFGTVLRGGIKDESEWQSEYQMYVPLQISFERTKNSGIDVEYAHRHE
jgi:hypothetical protein